MEQLTSNAVIDQPVKYAATEGGEWLEAPKELRNAITNPELMCVSKGKSFIIFDWWGGFCKVSSLLWSNGDRWDAFNGMTQGTLPR